MAKPQGDLPASRRNSVRIIGGAWRGRRVGFPDLPDLRPTPDRVRETLFNWLQHDVTGSRCLDLFAGSGALGLEALSRGAASAVFVEASKEVADNLTAQLARLHAGNAARVLNMPAETYLKGPAEAYDIVFLDPPFKSGAVGDYVRQLSEGGWLNAQAHIYLENPKSAGAPELPPGMILSKSKSAGEVGYHLARVTGR